MQTMQQLYYSIDESLVYRCEKDENGLNLTQLGQSITLPQAAQLDDYYVDANRLSSGTKPEIE